MAVTTLAWVLPRPRQINHYPGSYPQHFEKKLLEELGNPTIILQPFGGMAEYGLRLDISLGASPNILGDAHRLPFKDNSFDAVILDPPYDIHYSKRLYSTGKIKWSACVKEASRVCKEGGYVVSYHMVSTPVPIHTLLVKRILLETRLWHAARIIHIHIKDTQAYHIKGTKLGKICKCLE